MNKNILDMTDEDLKNLKMLTLDDSFIFNCKACGKCCKNRHDIILTPYDMFRIAQHFGRTTLDIFKRYCEVYEGDQSHLPVVRLLPVPPENSCPFLHKRKCRIHERKPVICRVYPLARIIGESVIGYYLHAVTCNHNPQSITVREWIGDVASEEAEHAGQLWGEIAKYVHALMQPEVLQPEEARERALAHVFNLLWLQYDIKKEFVPQLQENFERLKQKLADDEGLDYPD